MSILTISPGEAWYFPMKRENISAIMGAMISIRNINRDLFLIPTFSG
jgi:hypothetical protein